MRKRYPPSILLSGDHDEAAIAIPFAQAKLQQLVRRLDDNWGASDFYLDVFPGVDVRIEVSGPIQTIHIDAEVGVTFLLTNNFSDTGPGDRFARMFYLDPIANKLTEKFTVDEADQPWMTNPQAPDDLGLRGHYVSGAVGIDVLTATLEGRETPTAQFKSIDGVWTRVNQTGFMNLVNPWEVLMLTETPPSGPADESLNFQRSKHTDGNKEWAYAFASRINPQGGGGPYTDDLEWHIAYREEPDVHWISQFRPDINNSGDPPNNDPIWVDIGSNNKPVQTDNQIWNVAFRPGHLETVSGVTTLQQIYEYDFTTFTNNLVHEIVFPDNDAALAALGKVEYMQMLLYDVDSQWCGFATYTWATVGGQESADVHFYLAPIEDIVNSEGVVTTPGGMANAVKVFTFNIDDDQGNPGTVQNGAFIPRLWHHIGGNKFAWAIYEDDTNRTTATWKLALGTFDFSTGLAERKLQSGAGYRLTGRADHHREWVCGEIEFQPDTQFGDYVNLNLLEQTATRWIDGTIVDVDGEDISATTPFNFFTDFAFEG